MISRPERIHISAPCRFMTAIASSIGGVSTPARQISNSLSRAASQPAGESSAARARRGRAAAAARRTSRRGRASARARGRRRRSSIATKPECEAAHGNERARPLPRRRRRARRRPSPRARSPRARGSDAPWPRHSLLSTRRLRAQQLGDLRPALLARAPARQEQERRLPCPEVVVARQASIRLSRKARSRRHRNSPPPLAENGPGPESSPTRAAPGVPWRAPRRVAILAPARPGVAWAKPAALVQGAGPASDER